MFPLRAIARVAAISLITCVASAAASAAEPYEPLGLATSAPPSGWLQFCDTYAGICDTKPLAPVEVALDHSALATLTRIDLWVNHNIKPETDMQHYGMIQWWRYPDDGAGACHSYALLKRRLLIQAGWPRQSLLMTIVHESDNEGHAVLTVVTDHGDYILDNLTDKILPWSKTPYLYYMRQSQTDPNAWVWINDDHADFPTSTIRAPQRASSAAN
jgi:predicted transglutaminase-like cysteine proteinase